MHQLNRRSVIRGMSGLAALIFLGGAAACSSDPDELEDELDEKEPDEKEPDENEPDENEPDEDEDEDEDEDDGASDGFGALDIESPHRRRPEPI